MKVPIDKLISAMAAAARPSLETGGQEARAYAESESTKMAHTLSTIIDLKLSGQIDEGQAAALVEMQKQAAVAVFCAVAGIGLVAAQNAINAALDAIRNIVNEAIKFPLL